MDDTSLRTAVPLRPTSRPVNGAGAAVAPLENGKLVETAGLIGDLLDALRAERISYCHWKSNWKIDDWLMGEGDLDLLVAREDVSRFVAAISSLGFKRAFAPNHELPGVANYYGCDFESGRFVHIHAHYQLVLGHDATKNYRLPLEQAMLDSAVMHGPIRIASPEFELALFVIRMMLKYSSAETLGRRATDRLERHNRAIIGEIDHLRNRIDIDKFRRLMRDHFPALAKREFDDCLDALRSEAAAAEKLRAANRLKRAIDTRSRGGRANEAVARCVGQAAAAARWLTARPRVRKRMDSGGSMIALVGGDGSGKTTCVREMKKWLGTKFETRTTHFGKPPKSLGTLAVVGAQRLRRWVEKRMPVTGAGTSGKECDPFQPDANFLQRLRWLSTARDRYRLYKKIRRFTSNGGIAICDRLPIGKIRLMDGPRIARSLDGESPTRLQRFMIERERSYYKEIDQPDLLIVLRVDAATAAARKTSEPAEHVIPRADELWRADWSGTNACVIDANRPLDQVLTDVRELIWKRL